MSDINISVSITDDSHMKLRITREGATDVLLDVPVGAERQAPNRMQSNGGSRKPSIKTEKDVYDLGGYAGI